MVKRTAGGRLCAASRTRAARGVGDRRRDGHRAALSSSRRRAMNSALPTTSRVAPQAEFHCRAKCRPTGGADFGACGYDDCGDACGDCSHGTTRIVLRQLRRRRARGGSAPNTCSGKPTARILPPLVTDSPIGTAPGVGLVRRRSVIAGNNVVGNSWRSGYRLEAGVWLDDCNSLALVGDYFNLGDDDYDYFFAGDSGRNTGRPFFNTQSGTQDRAVDLADRNTDR